MNNAGPKHSPQPRVAVIGLGYVGLTTAVGLKTLGCDVIGVDTDCHRLELVRAGTTPMHEPALQEALRRVGSEMRFTSDITEALAAEPDVIMIAVQTPAPPNGPSDTSFVEAAARDIGRNLRAPAIVVVRSTAPAGTAARVGAIVAEEFGRMVPVASNPEFLVEGRAFEAFVTPERIVIGVDDSETGRTLAEMYASLNARTIVTDVATAELSKYAANAFLSTQISFINEIADLAEVCGADVETIGQILKLDKRIGERAYLSAGLGFGGSCLPKDLRTLAHMGAERGVPMRLADAVSAINDDRAERLIARLSEAVGGLQGKRIAVWGLAYKNGTDDVRESPAINVVRQLVSMGADVRAYDPLAEPAAAVLVGTGILCDTLYDPLADAEALLVVTDCREFSTPDFSVMHSRMRVPLIVDGRNVVDASSARTAGFIYLGVSAPAEAANGVRQQTSL
jgi:UDPglucose 6-dehydrogenase